MALPTTYKTFRRTTGDLPRTIKPSSETLNSDLKPHQVLIKIHAVSLNFRDVAMVNGRYPVEVEERGIPCSDCAAEVVKIGSDVRIFSTGDRVSPVFDLGHLVQAADDPMQALGGDTAGVLREYAIFDEEHLVKIPNHLSWEEGSTLACAGVTAWTALDSLPENRRNGSALLQGTGGVSLFALLLCDAAGMQAIVTSSSDSKIENITKLGSRVDGINYRTTTDQKAKIYSLTNERGVDFVVNNTGPASIPNDIEALCPRGGTVSLVGFLAGFDADWDPASVMKLMNKQAKLKGIGVGSKTDFEDLCRFLEAKKVGLGPIVDRVFAFEESEKAFDYLYSGQHSGKVVIKVG